MIKKVKVEVEEVVCDLCLSLQVLAGHELGNWTNIATPRGGCIALICSGCGAKLVKWLESQKIKPTV